MPAAIEIVIVVPTDMIAGPLVEKKRARALIGQWCRMDANPYDFRYPFAQPWRAIGFNALRRAGRERFIGDGATLLVRRQIAALGLEQAARLSFDFAPNGLGQRAIHRREMAGKGG